MAGLGSLAKEFGRATSSIGKELKRGYKSVTDTTVGKIAFWGAAIYLTGGAMGAWSTPFTTAAGGAAGAAAGGGVGGSVGATGTAVGAGELAAGTEAAAASMEAIPSFAANPELATASDILQPGVTDLTGSAAPQLASTVNNAGIISNAMSGAGTFVKENPLLTAVGVNALSGMMAPDELDILREKRKYEEDLRAERQENLKVGNIDLGVSPGADFLRSRGRSRGGVINSAVRG